jgi:hypothetical protein
MSARDDERSYHAAAAYVQIGPWAFTEDELWRGVDNAESAGIPLDQIGLALALNWCATAIALATGDFVTLHTIIADEALRTRP